MRNRSIVGEILLIKIRFFSKGWREQLLNWSGKTPVDRERLIMLVIVGRIACWHFLRREIGIGSRSQEVGDLEKSLATSSTVAGWKKDRSGGSQGGETWGEEVVFSDVIEERSFSIFSEKNEPKDWARESKVLYEGEVGAVFLCSKLFIEFQSFLGLLVLVERREELYSFLALIIAEW